MHYGEEADEMVVVDGEQQQMYQQNLREIAEGDDEEEIDQ